MQFNNTFPLHIKQQQQKETFSCKIENTSWTSWNNGKKSIGLSSQNKKEKQQNRINISENNNKNRLNEFCF